MTLVQFMIINLGALIGAAGGIFLKRLSDQLDHQSPLSELALYAIKSPNLWLGGFCYVFPIFLWTYLLKYMELTRLQPLLSFVYVYTIILAMIFLGEIPSMTRLWGIALIVAGVIFVGRS